MSTNVDVAKLDLVSLAVLFVCIVAIALLLVSVIREGSSILLVLAPTAVGVAAILNLRR